MVYNNQRALIDDTNNYYLCRCRTCNLYESLMPGTVRNAVSSGIGEYYSRSRIRGRFLKRETQRSHIHNPPRTVRITSYERRHYNSRLIRSPSPPTYPIVSTFVSNVVSGSQNANNSCEGCRALQVRVDSLTTELDRVSTQVRQLVASHVDIVRFNDLENRLTRMEALNQIVHELSED